MKKNIKTLSIQGCLNVVDDIVVYGSSEAEHDANVKRPIERCQEKNILLNEGNACLKKTEISFLGHIIVTNGVKPDSCKVKVIIDTPAPNNLASVRRFCGIIQYLAALLCKWDVWGLWGYPPLYILRFMTLSCFGRKFKVCLPIWNSLF